MTGVHPGALVADITWLDVESRLRNGAVAVLPVGAAAKEHGRHLPMNTDYLQCQWLAGQLIVRANVLVWPTVSYGYYPVFVDYPGSCSLTESTFITMVGEIIDGICNAGADRLLVVNTGISTIAPLRLAVETAPPTVSCRLVNVYQGEKYRAAADRLEQQPRRGHADELETSLLLAIRPWAVDMDEAVSWVPGDVVPGKLYRHDTEQPNYSPAGVIGDPTLANAEKGRVLSQAMVEDVIDALTG